MKGFHRFGFTLTVVALSLSAGAQAFAQQAQKLNQIYRGFSKGDHLYSTNQSEFALANYKFEPAGGFYLFDEQPSFPNVSVYRCVIPGTAKHFLSTDPNCEGNQTEAHFGYASTVPQPGLVLLQRYYNKGTGDHVNVFSPQIENLFGFTPEDMQVYVIPLNNGVVNSNPSAPLPVVQCTLASIAAPGKPSRIFQERAMSEAAATDLATRKCTTSSDPISLCLPALGASVSCQWLN